jgi:transcriptional regulator with XRE-family HTH domain
MEAKAVGIKIAKYRKEKNMTQAELAEILAVTNKAVSKWETGAGLPDIATLPTLASALDVNVNDLIYEIAESSENKSTGVQRRNLKMFAVLVTAVLVLTVTSSIVLLLIFNQNNEHDNENIIVNPIEIDLKLDADGNILLLFEEGMIRKMLLEYYNIQQAYVLAIQFGENFPDERFRNTPHVDIYLSTTDYTKLTNVEQQNINEFVRELIPSISSEAIQIAYID